MGRSGQNAPKTVGMAGGRGTFPQENGVLGFLYQVKQGTRQQSKKEKRNGRTLESEKKDSQFAGTSVGNKGTGDRPIKAS